MAKTQRDLVYKALAVLGVIKEGETPADEDYAGVDAYVDSLIARLAAGEIVYVNDTDAIQDEWFQPLAVLLADDASDEYGAPIDPKRIALAENRLVRMNRGRPAYGPIKTEYF